MKRSSIDSLRLVVSSYMLLSEREKGRERERLRKISRKSSVQGKKYPRYKSIRSETNLENGESALAIRTSRAGSLPKRGLVRLAGEYLHGSVHNRVCPRQASRWHILKNADAKVFLAELYLAHSTNWRFFLLAPSFSRPFRAKTLLVSSAVPLGRGGKLY